MKIVSVCTIYPTRQHPAQGVFVQRRLAALSRFTRLRVLKPTPWFPLVRRYRDYEAASEGAPAQPAVHGEPMFYVPGVLKGLDGRWLERSVYPVLKRWSDVGLVHLVDA